MILEFDIPLKKVDFSGLVFGGWLLFIHLYLVLLCAESQSREAPLEMGIGSFLLYLVVASKTELDKMTNLRIQMEMFLLNAKEDLQKKELQANPPMSSNEASGYQFSPQEFSNLASSIFQESSTSVLQEEYTEFEVSKPEDHHRGTYHNSKLQAEVETLPLDEKAEDRHTKHQIQRQRKLKVSPFYLLTSALTV